MEKTPLIIITLFSADKVRLDKESVARVLAGDYPIRVKSKVLATIREICAESPTENVVGFLPITRESRDFYQKYPIPFPEDVSSAVTTSCADAPPSSSVTNAPTGAQSSPPSRKRAPPP